MCCLCSKSIAYAIEIMHQEINENASISSNREKALIELEAAHQREMFLEVESWVLDRACESSEAMELIHSLSKSKHRTWGNPTAQVSKSQCCVPIAFVL